MFSREEAINNLAQQDAERFTLLQSQYLHEMIKTIQGYGGSGILNEIEKAKDQFTKNEITEAEYNEKQMRSLEKLTNVYALSAELCGFSKGSVENYCIAIQKQSSKKAIKAMDGESLSGMADELGWTCQYAKNNFGKKGLLSERKITSLYTKDDKGKCIVNKDKDGKPLVKDGDFALLLDEKNHAWHCIRLNVDKNGVLTYSAGNTEQDHKTISYLSKFSAAIIPTQDYANSLAHGYYNNMSDAELQKLADERGISFSAPQKTDKEATKAQMKRNFKLKQATSGKLASFRKKTAEKVDNVLGTKLKDVNMPNIVKKIEGKVSTTLFGSSGR